METLKEGTSAWVLSEFEWRGLWGVSAVNIGNKILVIGIPILYPNILVHLLFMDGRWSKLWRQTGRS